MTPDSGDHEIIQRCQRGNAQAFGFLVKRYMRRAYCAALGLVGSHADAEDLSQEAFVRAYRAIGRFQEGRPFFTWYYRILRNLCLNHLRDRARSTYHFSELSERDLMSLTTDEEDNPEALAERSEMISLLWTALGDLGELDREVIVLKEFQELSYKEMAEALDVPMGTIMSRLYNARRRLAEVFKEYL